MTLASGLGTALFRRLAGQRLSVLTFHALPMTPSAHRPGEVTLNQFEELLWSLRRFVTFLPLEEAVMRLQAGTLPKGAASITLDDGYVSWRHGVAPMLERLNLHATFFISTGQLQGKRLWNERLEDVLAKAGELNHPMDLHLRVNGRLLAWPVGTLAHRRQALRELDELIKRSVPEQRESLLTALEAQVPGSGPQSAAFTADDVRYLCNRGFGIGAHTVNHPILSQIPLPQALHEMRESREVLEGLVGQSVTGFAYPNGRPVEDFGLAHVEAARRSGFRYAVTTAWGTATSGDDVFQLPRFTPWGPGLVRTFAQMVRNLTVPSAPLCDPQGSAPRRRGLMVAFHFPPQTGSSGMLRTLNFAKYLPAHGWEATVLTAHPRAYEKTATDLVRDIPLGCRVLRACAWDTARHLAWRGKYLNAMAVPDRWWSWWPFAVWRGGRHLRQSAQQGQRYGLVWSTYPIASAHLIGGALARLSGLPWVADFRDPMVSDNYPPAGLRRKAWLAIERYTMRNAALCVFTTTSAAAQYGQRYPHAVGRLRVVENGYDEDAFSRAVTQRPGVDDSTVLLLHSGVIYPRDRDPTAFFEAVAAWIKVEGLDRTKVCVRFRATGHDQYVREIAQQCGVADVLDLAPALPYAQAIGEMMGADLLLLFQGSQFNAQIPAKVYEYLRAGRSVLGLVDPEGQTAKVLADYASAICMSISDPKGIQRALVQWNQARHEAVTAEQLLLDQARSRRHSRESLTALLAKEIHAVAIQEHVALKTEAG